MLTCSSYAPRRAPRYPMTATAVCGGRVELRDSRRPRRPVSWEWRAGGRLQPPLSAARWRPLEPTTSRAATLDPSVRRDSRLPAPPKATALPPLQVLPAEPAQLRELDHGNPIARRVSQEPEPNVPVDGHHALTEKRRGLDLREVAAGADLGSVFAGADPAHEGDARVRAGGVLFENPDQIGSGASHRVTLKVLLLSCHINRHTLEVSSAPGRPAGRSPAD